MAGLGDHFDSLFGRKVSIRVILDRLSLREERVDIHIIVVRCFLIEFLTEPTIISSM